MRIATNLAAKPFRDFSMFYTVGALFLVAGTLVLGLEAWDVWSSIERGRNARAKVALMNRQTERERAELNLLAPLIEPAYLKKAAKETAEIERLIQTRRFDWDEFLNALEQELPPNVRLEGLDPDRTKDGFDVRIRAVSRNLQDLNGFVDKLEKSEAFEHVFVRSQSQSESGEIDFQLEAVYRPDAGRKP